MVTRRAVLGTLAIGALAAGGGWAGREAVAQAAVRGDVGPVEWARAVEFLAANPAIDMHAHPGRTFVRDAHDLTWKLRLYQALGNFEPRVIDDMRAGGVAAACFSGVADFPVLDLVDGMLRSVRPFGPGEAWAYYQAQARNHRELVERGLVVPVLAPADVARARAAGRPGAIFAIEGGDFIEDDLAHAALAHADGVRIVTLVHYVSGGRLGDIMTALPVHGGLTDLGRAVLGEFNRVGILVDIAHASERTAFDVLAATNRPVIASHTHVLGHGTSHPRFISPRLARAIADAGGLVGAWPAGIGIETMEAFADRVVSLVRELGAAHVGLGTDMDANYAPVFDNYRQLPRLVALLFRRCVREDDAVQLLGGNFLRVFAAQTER